MIAKLIAKKPARTRVFILTSNCVFQPHIPYVEAEVAKVVGISYKLQYLFSNSALVLLSSAIVHPHLSFAFIGLFLILVCYISSI